MCAQRTLEGEVMNRFEKILESFPEELVPDEDVSDVWRVQLQFHQRPVQDLDREGHSSVSVYLCGQANAEDVKQQKNHDHPYPGQPGRELLASRLVHAKDVGSLVFLVKEEGEAMSRFEDALVRIFAPEMSVPAVEVVNQRDGFCKQGHRRIKCPYRRTGAQCFHDGRDAQKVNEQPDRYPNEDPRGSRCGLLLVIHKDGY